MSYIPSRAHGLFRQTMVRAITMLETSKQFADLEAPSPRPESWSYNSSHSVFPDMGRAAIVIAVAAFDDFHTRRFAEAVIPCLQKKGPTDHLVEILASSGFGLKDALNLLSMERPHRRIRAHIEKYLSDYTTQRFTVIDTLFGSLGIKSFSEHVERKCGRKTLRRGIEKLVKRRHDIVHGGDLTQHGKLQDLDPDDALRRMLLMEEFVNNGDEIVHKCVT